ncbi:phage holin family protein [Sphingomonas gilva]|nr:phage holin family protein [Sphingomonas gilva]
MEQKGNTDSIVGLVTRLIDDVERFVRAEISLYRAQLFDRLKEAQTAIVMLIAVFMLAQATLFTLLVVLVLILRRWIGIYWASAIVIGLAIVIMALLASAALKRIKAATRVSEGDE